MSNGRLTGCSGTWSTWASAGASWLPRCAAAGLMRARLNRGKAGPIDLHRQHRPTEDAAANTVTTTITVGPLNADVPAIAVSPDGSKVYVTNEQSNSVAVIDTRTHAVTATIPVGFGSIAVAVTPDGSKVYVTNANGSVLVVDPATNAVTATIAVGGLPWGVALTPDGSKIYVANEGIVYR
jgi:YVTN family beta-propeller protein